MIRDMDPSALQKKLAHNAGNFYREGEKDFDLQSIVHHHSPRINFFRKVGLVLTFPFNGFRIRKVRQHQIALVKYNGDYFFKGPGYQFVLNPLNKIERVILASNRLIIHGPHKLIRVAENQMGFGYNLGTDSPLVLGPGTHYFNDPAIIVSGPYPNTGGNFRYSIGENQIDVIGVDEGSAAILFNRKTRCSEVRNPGIYFIKKQPTYNDNIDFQLYLSTKKEIFYLEQNTYLTRDTAKLDIKFAIPYQITKPRLAFEQLCKGDTFLHSGNLQRNLEDIIRDIFVRIIGELDVIDTESCKYDAKIPQSCLLDVYKIQGQIQKLFLETANTELEKKYGLKIEEPEFIIFKNAWKPNLIKKPTYQPYYISHKNSRHGKHRRDNIHNDEGHQHNNPNPIEHKKTSSYLNVSDGNANLLQPLRGDTCLNLNTGGISIGLDPGLGSGVQPCLDLSTGMVDMGMRI